MVQCTCNVKCGAVYMQCKMWCSVQCKIWCSEQCKMWCSVQFNMWCSVQRKMWCSVKCKMWCMNTKIMKSCDVSIKNLFYSCNISWTVAYYHIYGLLTRITFLLLSSINFVMINIFEKTLKRCHWRCVAVLLMISLYKSIDRCSHFSYLSVCLFGTYLHRPDQIVLNLCSRNSEW